MENIITVEVKKEDICLIGHTVYNDNGFTTFVCDTDKANYEYLLLRNILKCFGDYKIVDTYEEFENEDDLLSVIDRVFVTKLPYSTYLSIDFQY